MNPVRAGDLAIGRGEPPRIMGVLNVSLESPYDPSVFSDTDAAVGHIDHTLIDEGADIVDIGLASANKRFDVLTAEEERERLETAIDIIDRVDGEAVFSIETRYSSVADEALANGFDMVNDVCGFADPEMPDVCDAHGVPVVKMAGPGELERPGALDSVEEIYDVLATDPAAEQTIIDPAFGGWSETKDEAVDRETFHRLGEFRAIDRPMLVSINRKNFLRNLADRSTEQALPVSLAATALAVERGADVIRTHDVAETRDAAIIGHQLGDGPVREEDVAVRELTVRSQQELERHLQRLGGGKAAAADGVIRAFEIGSLDPADRTVLKSVTADVGGTVVTGRDDDRIMLLVTPRELRTLEGQIAQDSPSLAERFKTIRETS